jgi:methylmalonyl-CoA mutase N-terminal domain/subunit
VSLFDFFRRQADRFRRWREGRRAEGEGPEGGEEGKDRLASLVRGAMTDPDEVTRKGADRLAAVKAERDDDAVAAALDAVGAAARSDDNVIPAVVEAVKADATMGEGMDVFADVYGRYRPGDGAG